MIFHIILEWLPCSTWDFVPLHHSHIQGPREGPEQSPSSGHAPGPPIKSHQYIYQWGQGSSSMIQKTRQGPKNNTEHHLNIVWFSIFWQFISYWAIICFMKNKLLSQNRKSAWRYTEDKLNVFIDYLWKNGQPWPWIV